MITRIDLTIISPRNWWRKILFEKVDQNISEGQFLLGQTFLLVDLCDELLIYGSALENLEECFGSPPQSGALWHAAFVL